MIKNKNNRKALWIYAVVLFTSAFIVLLLTAYSQIKFNKNIDEYKEKISTEEGAKNHFQFSLESAVNENKNLRDELEKAKSDLQNEKSNKEQLENNLNDMNKKLAISVSSYETLMMANEEYDAGNITGCALLLTGISNPELLGETGKSIYESLKDKTYRKAAEKLYFEGYSEYSGKKYPEAVEKLKSSLLLSENEYFSDDCMYFIAYSSYYIGDFSTANQYIDKILEQYPESTYMTDVIRLKEQCK